MTDTLDLFIDDDLIDDPDPSDGGASPLAPPQVEPPRLEGLFIAEGDVSRIIFENRETGFRIMKVQFDGEKEAVSVKGIFPMAAVGVRIRVTGPRTRDPKWGEQILAENVVELVPSTLEGVERYLAAKVDGIGPALAHRIVEKFGLDTLRILSEQASLLIQVQGVNGARAEEVGKVWARQRAERDFDVFLMAKGETLALATKIWTEYGEGSMEVVTRNPYRLSFDVAGIGFETADRLAMAIGIEPTSPDRLRAGVLQALHNETTDGHSFTEVDTLATSARALLDLDEMDIGQSRLVDAAYSLEESKHVVIEDVKGRKLVYLSRTLKAEERTATRLVELAKATPRALTQTPQAGGASPPGRVEESAPREEDRASVTCGDCGGVE